MSTLLSRPPRPSRTNLVRPDHAAPPASDESGRADRHPISRWYVQPLATRLANTLAVTPVRPSHLTLLGLGLALAAAGLLAWRPLLSPAVAILVWTAWLCDRTDGSLARAQGSATPWGAWLDANVDELVDLGLHGAVAAAIGTQTAWLLLAGFLAGKYLFLHGLATEPSRPTSGEQDRLPSDPAGWLRRGYHLPANADVRLHLLVLALVTGFLTAELALVAIYYNLRWAARYVLVARRLGGAR